MAQVHPSRLGRVPPDQEPSSRSRSPEKAPSREEQLKQKLLNRRKPEASRTNGGGAPSLSIRGRAEGAGRELIDVDERNKGESSSAGLLSRLGDRAPVRAERKVSPPRRSPRRGPRDEWEERNERSPWRGSRLRMDEDRPQYDSPPHRTRRYDNDDRMHRDHYSPRRSPTRHDPPHNDRHPPRRSEKWDQLPPRPRSPPREAAGGGGMHPDRMRMIHGNRPLPPPQDDYRHPPPLPPPTMLPPLRFPPFPPPNAPASSSGPPGDGAAGGSGTNGDGTGDGVSVVNAPNWTAPPPPRRLGFGGGLDFEKRRMERERSTISIWPPSPKEPWRDPDEVEAERKEAKRAARRAKAEAKKNKVSRHRRRRYTSETPSSEDDSEDDRGKRRRRRRYSDESSSEDDLSDARSADRKKRRRGTSSAAPSEKKENREVEGDAWIEKAPAAPVARVPRTMAERDVLILPGTVEEGSDEEVGPKLPTDATRKEKHQFFPGMLPGEAEAMAAYAAAGQRIPRRGEVGLDAERIAQFEESGYVMSGNRNKKMNAVRLRKENQVISAEEKRAILNLQREERVRKEGAIISQFKELMDQNLRQQGLNKG